MTIIIIMNYEQLGLDASSKHSVGMWALHVFNSGGKDLLVICLQSSTRFGGTHHLLISIDDITLLGLTQMPQKPHRNSIKHLVWKLI